MANDSLDGLVNENYFESPPRRDIKFDSALLRQPVGALPVKTALVVAPETTVTEAMRRMQDEHRGCVLVTDDGTDNSKLIGIFTERDVLFRIVDRGRNPAALPIGDVMTANPECLSIRSGVAYALNMMSVGGFRHVPVVDDEHRPAFVISVRNVVEFLVEAFPREILNLPKDHHTPNADPGPKRTREGA
jgi:CBS domain-containing protein